MASSRSRLPLRDAQRGHERNAAEHGLLVAREDAKETFASSTAYRPNTCIAPRAVLGSSLVECVVCAEGTSHRAGPAWRRG